MVRPTTYIVFAIVVCGVSGLKPLNFAGREIYEVETTVQLQEVTQREREVGYKVKAVLSVEETWHADDERLLRFELAEPRLLIRGANAREDFLPHGSVWDSYPHTEFYAHFKGGLVLNVYLDANELFDVLNYKRSLISQFQLQTSTGAGIETDASGVCRVTYETLDENTVRKIKSECEGEWGESRRVARYTLKNGRLVGVHAEEVHEARLAAGGGLKARAWLRLSHRATAEAAPLAVDRAEALAAVPSRLAPAPLRAPALVPEDSVASSQSEDSQSTDWEPDEAERGGDAGQAWRAMRAREALCGETRARLGALLERVERGRLPAALRVLGSCGSKATHAVAADLLRLREPSSPLASLAPHYFAALALAPNPHESVVESLLASSSWPREEAEARDADVAAAALAALGAVSRTLRRREPESRLAAAVAASLISALAECRDERCRVAYLRALANCAPGGASDALLSRAERGSDAEALAALDALDALSADGPLSVRTSRRLQALIVSGRPLVVRASALDVVLRAAADAPFTLLSLVTTLTHQAEGELVRVLWQRLVALGESTALFRAALPPTLRTRALFAPATSVALRRRLSPPTAAPAAAVGLDSLQIARGGALRRGVVRLRGPDGDALVVDLVATGLEELAGGGGDDEPTAASLALSAGGARLPPVSLFDGRAELAAHVWAGTASAPTPALRAILPLASQTRALRLLDGVALRGRLEALSAVALDAHAQVSVWSRSARGGVEARGGVAALASLRAEAAWGELDAVAELELEPRLRIAADLDFYDGVALCVRVRVPAAPQTLRVTLQSRLGASGRRVRRVSERRWAAEGRTLSLGPELDAACRSLGSAED
ncbi:microsomal triglyceride transfer protein large subunit [Pieris rapae]|uniref:microsomal triglyceride transfer protein large subunit n=1 Tax=Pieris rapae TaxID=64459 RepID=UPI001E27F7A5|nr:microsomal triglyceride transfer protein large subunit [Pieris rapae]